jgi:hypothetical protein
MELYICDLLGFVKDPIMMDAVAEHLMLFNHRFEAWRNLCVFAQSARSQS